MNERKSDPPAAPASAEQERNDPQPRPTGHPDAPAAEAAEMGGEAPCQLHRWWDDGEGAGP